MSAERQHLWFCTVRTRYMGFDPKERPAYFLTEHRSIESLELTIEASRKNCESVELLLPVQYLGRVGNGRPIVDLWELERIRQESAEYWAEQDARTWMRVVHGIGHGGEER